MMGYTPKPKAEKLAWPNQLTRLSCLMVIVSNCESNNAEMLRAGRIRQVQTRIPLFSISNFPLLNGTLMRPNLCLSNFVAVTSPFRTITERRQVLADLQCIQQLSGCTYENVLLLLTHQALRDNPYNVYRCPSRRQKRGLTFFGGGSLNVGMCLLMPSFRLPRVEFSKRGWNTHPQKFCLPLPPCFHSFT